MSTTRREMTKAELEKTLTKRIEHEYAKRADTCGWRLLASPRCCLRNPRVAFIGLNPGGTYQPEDHGEFAMDEGSAYVVESWGNHRPGTSPLQTQIRALFDRIGENPSEVLAGNLVPFRSPSEKTLRHPDSAIEFGRGLWADIFEHLSHTPEIVITMGQKVRSPLCSILGIQDASLERVPVNWGRVGGYKGRFETGGANGRFINLPHLSRYRIATREESRCALDALLA